MAKAKSTSTKSEGRFYPSLEEFVEQESPEKADALFEETRAHLAEAKGTKAAGAKKALAAIDKTQGLLNHLFDVRARLARQPAKGKK